MTRSKLREHCFKMLFCADFYPAEEKEEQIDRYFDEPKEDETTPEGVDEILHDVEMSPEDESYLKAKTEAVMRKIPELDEKIDAVAEGWKTKRMGKYVGKTSAVRKAVVKLPEGQDINLFSE